MIAIIKKQFGDKMKDERKVRTIGKVNCRVYYLEGDEEVER